MLRVASDADVSGTILKGIRSRILAIDLVRSLDVLSEDAPDFEVLAWAAAEERVLITNDRQTMVGHAYERIESFLPLPGVIVTSQQQPIKDAVDDLQVIIEAMPEDEIANRVIFLPFRFG